MTQRTPNSEVTIRGPGEVAPGEVAEALSRAVPALLALQRPDGHWFAELESNVTIDVSDLFLRFFLRLDPCPQIDGTATWVRNRQQADGGWANFHGGPPDLNTSIEAYLALRLVGDSPDAPHMKTAAERIRALGGLERTRALTKIWLALFGLVPWRNTPALPPELIRLPPWMPLNIYDLASYARHTIVPLTIVSAIRPTMRIPGLRLDELHSGAGPAPRPPLRTEAGMFRLMDTALHAYGRRAPRRLRQDAINRAVHWLVTRQEADGWWGGIQTQSVYSILGLSVAGYEVDHPVIQAGLKGLDTYTITDETGRRFIVAPGPVWDTALAMVALLGAGVRPDHEAMLAGADWLMGKQALRRGDWAVRRPDVRPGGWAFEFANEVAPDNDDTAEVIRALRLVEPAEEAMRERRDIAVRRGIDWLIGMQCADGGWGAFDADNTRWMVRKLPISDFGEIIDPPTADVTAHAVEMLAEIGYRDHAATRRGVAWLLRAQEPDGSWWGRWGTNYIYGTSSVLPALVAAGVPAGHPSVRRGTRWLVEHQNADGGWGEDQRSYDDPAGWSGRGESTPSQTAWALIGLLAAGKRYADGFDAARRGARWLLDRQLPDGTWDEAHFTGTGFPWDFPMRYHLYRYTFPIMALARYHAAALTTVPPIQSRRGRLHAGGIPDACPYQEG